MCDAWDHPATHTREHVVKAAEIRAQLCASRGLPDSQACHPPGLDECAACGRQRETAAMCEHLGVCDFDSEVPNDTRTNA